MSFIACLRLATGIACGIWGLVAGLFSFITFAGFAGTTTYFASPDKYKGFTKILKSFACNLTGFIYAYLAMYIGSKVGNMYFDAFLTGLISFLMVYQSKVIPFLDYMPAAFLACFTTYATGGDLNTIP